MITDEKVKELKRAHGADLFMVEVENGDEPIELVFKKPTRQVMSASAKFAQSDPLKGAEIMIENCLVHGDKKWLDDLTVFTAVAEQFGEINKAREATLKKL